MDRRDANQAQVDYEEQTVRQRHQAADGIYADTDQLSIGAPLEKKSPGVLKMDAITKSWTRNLKIIFFSTLVVMSYGRLLAASVIGTYQSIALDEWGVTGKAAMVRTIRQVLTATSLVVTAKLTDYIGRGFMLNTTALFWLVGPIVVATSTGLGSYIPGFLLYTLGHVAGNILQYGLAIDTTTLRNRLFMQLVFIFPSIINVWAGGVIADKVVNGMGWRWGSGMWAIISPVVCFALIIIFQYLSYKARREGRMDGIPSTWKLLRSRAGWVHMFWIMDVMGLLFLAGALACILLPLALGGGSAAKWKTADVITPLVIGVLLLPVFAIWEWKWARHPIFPFHLMRDKHVMSILLIALLKNIASSTRDSYMYFTLVVSFNQGVEGATRINSLENFASSLTVVFVALIVRRFRIVKPLVVAGVVLIVVAQGMLVRFRGGYSRSELAGLVAAELLDGIGTGLSSHPSLVAMQAKLSHEHALLVTSCWAVGGQAGGGVAAAISGAVWTNMLPTKLREGLIAANIPNATSIAQQVYRSPLQFVKTNPPGSPAREAVVNAYRDVQKVLCIIAVCIAAVLIPLSLLMDNVHLGEKRNLVDADESDEIPDMRRERDRSDSDIDEKGRAPRSSP
ncbi:putative Siderochrome-iron uptake transporter [Cutaneotrichosporon oleaginosum]|uniref:Putative Siderochrome-iron uptake transporter n=1 Tax=Cutaneotrichosporon oleaginosum TaxID=879819 RepID=A0A0J0XGS3_9TREE|nr:putative Siderochrome-iron uptake transporter [Cutaneotrichosporon oleaginosum]KLT40227.1 putative Siderochrome-iron uptake transporter [Cutaneotrichosporon oleaginosum]TXT10483.1 hypothetical protein COLE_04417 [Cutaneotrichosporon oleaginosum]